MSVTTETSTTIARYCVDFFFAQRHGLGIFVSIGGMKYQVYFLPCVVCDFFVSFLPYFFCVQGEWRDGEKIGKGVATFKDSDGKVVTELYTDGKIGIDTPCTTHTHHTHFLAHSPLTQSINHSLSHLPTPTHTYTHTTAHTPDNMEQRNFSFVLAELPMLKLLSK